MAFKLKGYKVFIASPSGLEKERKRFVTEIDKYNKNEALPRSFFFQGVGWEDTFPGLGRPQSLINQELKKCDFFILLLHDKWGSFPGVNEKNATSGTEEEFLIALDCCKSSEFPMKQVVCIFKSVSPINLADPDVQLQKVLEFKRKIETEKLLLYTTYLSLDEFGEFLRRNLGEWLRNENQTINEESIISSKYEHHENSLLIENNGDLILNENTDSESEGMIKNAWKLVEEGKLTDAEILFSKALIINPQEYPLLNYSRFLFETGQLDKSLLMANRVLEISKNNTTSKSVAKAYSYKAIILKTRGDFDGAIEMDKKALKIYEAIGYKEGLANQYGNLGIIFIAKGDLPRAETMINKSLEINKELGKQEGISNNYTTLGNILQTRGELDGAIEMYNRSFEIAEKSNNLVGMASNYGNIGNVLQIKGNYNDAEVMHNRSLDIYKKLGRLEGIANQYGNLGNNFQHKGDLDSALAMYSESIKINEHLGRLKEMAYDYGNLGVVLRAKGDLNGAELMHRKALEISEKIGGLKGIAIHFGNIGRKKCVKRL